MSRCYCQGCGWLNQFNGKWCPSGISFWCWGQLLWLPLASIGNRPTDSQLHLKWQTLKTCFLLALAMALSRSFIYTLSVAPGHFTFKVLWMANLQWLCFPGWVPDQESAVSQVPGWVTIPGISHLSLMTVRERCAQYISYISMWAIPGSFVGGIRVSLYLWSVPSMISSRATSPSGLSRWLKWFTSRVIRRFQ